MQEGDSPSMSERYPNEGVKLTRDQRGRLFYVYLKYNDEWPTHDGYYTTDCIVSKIVEAHTGREYEKVEGWAYIPFTYEKGQIISGQQIYFCHSVEELKHYQHEERTRKYAKAAVNLHLVSILERFIEKAEQAESKINALSNSLHKKDINR